MALYIDVVD